MLIIILISTLIRPAERFIDFPNVKCYKIAVIDFRSAQSSGAEEIYISASPSEKLPLEEKWRQIFTGIRNAS